MDTYKQLDQIILDETNVKSLTRIIANTEKGVLELVYSKGVYTWSLGGVQKGSDSPGMLVLLKSFYE